MRSPSKECLSTFPPLRKGEPGGVALCETRAGRAPRLNTNRVSAARHHITTRLGFTLIELMVVMTVIAILATLTLQVAGGLISQARESATKSTISKIQSLLNSRAQAFQRLTMRSGYLTGSSDYQFFSTSGYSASLTKTLTLKALQRKFFPQVQSDAMLTNPSLNPNIAGNTDATNQEVLYDFLTQSNVLGDSQIGTDTFSASEVSVRTTVNGQSLGSFVDAWRNPIRFYRWPTRLFRSGGQTSAMGAGAIAAISQNDTNNVKILFSTLPVFTGNLGPDPNLTLYPNATTPLYNTDLDRDPDDPLRECQYSYSNFEKAYHTPATYHVFLIVSAGPDGEFGMFAPNDSDPQDVNKMGHLGLVKPQSAWNSPNSNPLLDDIISLNIRAGGK